MELNPNVTHSEFANHTVTLSGGRGRPLSMTTTLQIREDIRPLRISTRSHSLKNYYFLQTIDFGLIIVASVLTRIFIEYFFVEKFTTSSMSKFFYFIF